MDIKKSDIITMASIKGGVGKSVLSILFSYVLKELGKKVLLIDLDPQNSLTSYFNRYISNIEKYNTYSMLKGDFYFKKYLNKINDYMYIIPSHPMLEKFNTETDQETFLEYYLNRNIINCDFDYILLDTSPGSNLLLKSALNTANYIIIPVQSEIWSIESFNILINAVNDITKFRKKIYNISIVENQFIKNRNTIKEVEDLLYKEYREYIKGKIHFSNSIKVLINGRLEPSKKEMYYREIKDTLKNIFSL
ncbi:ParA family protein [Borreliella burgdorferi]|uniref:ParA family protein n=1 Tax=Borreliella burgdorferi TaxID=139 RepID=UPI001E4F4958|nr:ParA family protein [Borreliella burgdorferi]MCD2378976.1 ParA family protein [Borreliella burgdorferi]